LWRPKTENVIKPAIGMDTAHSVEWWNRFVRQNLSGCKQCNLQSSVSSCQRKQSTSVTHAARRLLSTFFGGNRTLNVTALTEEGASLPHSEAAPAMSSQQCGVLILNLECAVSTSVVSSLLSLNEPASPRERAKASMRSMACKSSRGQQGLTNRSNFRQQRRGFVVPEARQHLLCEVHDL